MKHELARWLVWIGWSVIVGTVIFTACGPTTQPPTGPGTEYPCGVWGVTCSNGACCPWAHICGEEGKGFFNRCEPGYCCFDGERWPGSTPDAAPLPSNQRSVVKAKRPGEK